MERMSGASRAPSRRRVAIVVACVGAMSALVATGVTAALLLDRPAGSTGSVVVVPRETPLTQAFPGAELGRAAGVGNQIGQVTPVGLLRDGTVYGVATLRTGAASVTSAVTVDPRTGRQSVVDRGDAVTEPLFLAAGERWLIGVTEKPVAPRVTVGHGCDLAPAACRQPPAPPRRYWCHDRQSGRTVDITASLRGAGSRLGSQIMTPEVRVTDSSIVLVSGDPGGARHLAMAGCAATPRPLGFPLLPDTQPLGPGFVMSLEDRLTQGHRVLVQDTRSGATRTVLEGSGSVAAANLYGLAWTSSPDTAGIATPTAAPHRPSVRFAPWGGPERPLDVPAAGGQGHLALVMAGERVFLLADRTRPLGGLTLYDPARNTLTRLGDTRAQLAWNKFWAAGRYVLWDDGSAEGYRWLDLGPQPAPPARGLDDLHVRR
jgi:hypothetical protein